MSSLPSTQLAPELPPPTGIKRLSHRHVRIVELALAGLRRIDIARALDMTPENVGLVMKSALFQDELSRRQQVQQRTSDGLSAGQTCQASQILAEAAEEAARTMTGLLDSPDDKLKFASAKDILDRRGLGRGSTVPVTHITVERMQLLVTALEESRQVAASSSDGQPSSGDDDNLLLIPEGGSGA